MAFGSRFANLFFVYGANRRSCNHEDRNEKEHRKAHKLARHSDIQNPSAFGRQEEGTSIFPRQNAGSQSSGEYSRSPDDRCRATSTHAQGVAGGKEGTQTVGDQYRGES